MNYEQQVYCITSNTISRANTFPIAQDQHTTTLQDLNKYPKACFFGITRTLSKVYSYLLISIGIKYINISFIEVNFA